MLDYITALLKSKPFPENAFLDFLTFWSQESTKPLILFFDEVDGLTGDPLISFFKQVRTGFPDRPGHFPHSIVLIGLRDLEIIKLKLSRRAIKILMIVRLILLQNQSDWLILQREEIATLYLHHTEATGSLTRMQ